MVLRFFLRSPFSLTGGAVGMGLVWVTSAGKKGTLDASP
jgi:hypothetical protein